MRADIRIGDFRGYSYAELDPELLARVPDWLAEQRVADGDVLKPGRVFRWREYAIKFGGSERRWRDVLRPASALRSADLHASLLPLPTPQPYLALERRVKGRVVQSLLVSAFVAGRTLIELWDREPDAVAAFPLFLADMHRRRIFHGDLHVDNALWDGSAWYLIDLESVRHRMHGLFPQKFREGAWARVVYRLERDGHDREAGLRRLFDVYWSRLGLGGDGAAIWRRIRAQAQARQLVWQRVVAAAARPRP